MQHNQFPTFCGLVTDKETVMMDSVTRFDLEMEKLDFRDESIVSYQTLINRMNLNYEK